MKDLHYYDALLALKESLVKAKKLHKRLKLRSGENTQPIESKIHSIESSIDYFESFLNLDSE